MFLNRALLSVANRKSIEKGEEMVQYEILPIIIKTYWLFYSFTNATTSLLACISAHLHSITLSAAQTPRCILSPSSDTNDQALFAA